ncbi:hypothetical protein MMC07_004895 [Pseudocyphellaria aurata]|nr:hypothetical protein [Pseudocyphellaria aurata]
MNFGPQGFFGYGVCTSFVPARNDTPTENGRLAPGPHAVWWSTYSHAQLPDSKEIHHNESVRNCKTATDAGLILLFVPSSPALKSTRPNQSGRHLTSQPGSAVLMGDAARALQLSSGQGASQSLEDAQVLALPLRHYLGRSSS